MPSTRDLHPSIIRSCESRVDLLSTWNIRVCESVGALHEPSGGTKRVARGERRVDVWWFANELVGSCRESSRKSVKARDTFRMRSQFTEYNRRW